jgi:hypothetical protein
MTDHINNCKHAECKEVFINGPLNCNNTRLSDGYYTYPMHDLRIGYKKCNCKCDSSIFICIAVPILIPLGLIRRY